MPAAAVIPAPIAYIKVVAVKKLVVGYLEWSVYLVSRFRTISILLLTCVGIRTGHGLRYFTLRKLECFRQARPEYKSME